MLVRTCRYPLALALVASASLAAACSERAAPGAGRNDQAAQAPQPVPARTPDKHGYLKGSTHVHTNRSADSSTSVHDVVRWYREHDYDFIVITDHDRITEYAGTQELVVVPGVELTHNPGRCWPPPEPDHYCRVHVNALFVTGHERLPQVERERGPQHGRVRWDKRGNVWRVDMYTRALAESRALSGLAQINHPTWYRGVDGALLAELAGRGARFVEIANQALSEWNAGDLDHPSAEAIWDHALAAGQRIWGVASDDAHHYDDGTRSRSAHEAYFPAGTGFVMVRAEHSAVAIRAAMERGDFYSSTGVYLAAVESSAQRLAIEVASPGEHEIAFIGTRDGVGSQVLMRRRGRRAEMAVPSAGYVRAVITDERGRKAWVQPVFAQDASGQTTTRPDSRGPAATGYDQQVHDQQDRHEQGAAGE